MNKYFLPIFRILSVIALVGFTSCSDDKDDIVPDLATDSYFGTATLTYLDGDDTQPKTENINAIVLAHKVESDKISIGLHQQSQYYPGWYVNEPLLQTTMSFITTQTGAASADGAHFNQSQLNINYKYTNAVADENGRTLLSVKFCGQPNPAAVKDQIDPIGTYETIYIKHCNVLCFSDDEYELYHSDINNIPEEKWYEDTWNKHQINISPCDHDPQKLSVAYHEIYATSDEPFLVESLSGDLFYTVNPEIYTMVLKPSNKNSTYVIENSDNIQKTHIVAEKLNPEEREDGAVGLINASIHTFAKIAE